jgi:transcriptional regulator NrdR family protein
MVCIYCGSETNVTNSRHQKRLNHVWRRRKCQVCNAIFSTTEAADAVSALRVRSSRALEPFLRDNLLMSVYDSLRHRKSAITDATSLTATIVSNMYDLADNGVIEREAIITVTSAVLERFDKVAATHYKAFYPING